MLIVSIIIFIVVYLLCLVIAVNHSFSCEKLLIKLSDKDIPDDLFKLIMEWVDFHFFINSNKNKFILLMSIPVFNFIFWILYILSNVFLYLEVSKYDISE